MRSGTPVFAILIACGTAAADITHLRLEVSRDGTAWTDRLPAQPDDVVQVRASVTYESTTGVRPTGFAYLTWQPTIAGWGAADALLPFADRGNNHNGGSVADAPDQFGRISPFAATGPTVSDPYRGHVHSALGVRYLRIARSVITNWIGVGPTTGTAAANNFNGAGGIALVQKAASMRSSRDPAFNPEIENVVVFKFAVRFGSLGGARAIDIDAPVAGMTRNSTTGARQCAWFRDTIDPYGAIRTDLAVTGARIDFIPCPGAAALLGLMMARPRRSRSLR